MKSVEAIAIIGMGCRFPGGASNPEAYWDILKNGVDATVEVPAERWSLRRFFDEDADVPGKIYVRRGGFQRESIRAFDARFFGISPREAAPMDPQQRLLLEVAWEAFEDAGVVPKSIRGSKTGVYVGGFTLDNKIHLLNSLNREAISTHTAINATLVMLSNRLSYVFDLRGPSMTVDTACSSSLVALHLAVQTLRQGECDLALAGGVNLMFRPAYPIAMCKGGFLAPDGRCKSFDARGDGYARGEGAGVLILKPLGAALRDRDNIRAVVLETGVNQDGKTDGITLPNGCSQTALIHEVCLRAGVGEEQIQYVEAHGTGTRAGDSTEARSLSESLARHRPAGAGPLLIGSAKSNIGHLEAAAGVAGVIKTALALEKQEIPPSIHFQEPPELLDFDTLRLEVPGKLQNWPEHPGPPMAAVNSFGYGGTNAHALLARAPTQEPISHDPPLRPLVIPVSARSDRSLTRQLLGLFQLLEARPTTALADLGYTLARRRTHHDYRAAVVASTQDELLEHLRHFFETGERPTGFVTPVESRLEPAPAFVYTGMGPQSWGMGVELMAAEPAAAAAFEQCDAIWAPLTGWSLSELFANESGAAMREPRHAQPANFVLQVMLTESARAYGLTPMAVVGHSTGEIAAAWAAGSLSLEDAMRVAWHRSRLQQTRVGQGRMLAVGISAAETVPILADWAERIEVAAVNSPHSVTLAGDEGDLLALSELLTKDEIFNRMLMVDVAYHSRHMDDIEGEFLESLASLTTGEPERPLYSTVTGGQVRGPEQDKFYWWKNIRRPVLFADALDTMIDQGCNLFLEIGPHPVMAPSIKDCLRAAKKKGECFAALRRKESERAFFSATMAELYAQGVDFDWSKLYPAGNLVALPTYPWDRQDFWTESDGSRLDRLGSEEHPILSRRANEAVPTWDGDFSRSFHGFLQDHRIQGEPVFPAAGFVELALVARRDKSASVAIENLKFIRSLATFDTPVVRLHLNESDGSFSIYSRERTPDAPWNLNAAGTLLETPVPARHKRIDPDLRHARCSEAFDVGFFYDRVHRLGLQYETAFQCIREGRIGQGEVLVRLEIGAEAEMDADDYYVHPVLLDGALQSALALQVISDPTIKTVSLPVGIEQFRFHHKAGAAVWCHCKLAESGREMGNAELMLFDDDGLVLVEVFGLRTRAVLAGEAELSGQDELLYTNQWDYRPVEQVDLPQATRWLVFCDSTGVAEQLQGEAAGNRMTCIMVKPGGGFKKLGRNNFEVARGSRPDMELLLHEVDAATLAGVVYLWTLDVPDSLQVLPDSLTTGRADVVDIMHILQALEDAQLSKPPPITVCTVGTQEVLGGDAGSTAPGQHSVWGAVRALRLEIPHLRLKLVDLATRLPFVAARHLVPELRDPTDEAEVALRRDNRYVNRVVRLGAERYRNRVSTPGMHYVLESLVQGGLRRRAFVQEERSMPALGQVEIAVDSYGLSENDRLVMQLAARTMPPLSLQCVGRITTVGEAVTQLEPGQAVVVLRPQEKLASHIVVPVSAVLPYPGCFSHNDGLAVLDWLSAYYALFEAGGLHAGQWVLVHQASSGLGLAAVQLARWAEARVVATAGTEDRRCHVAALGFERVSDSRSLKFCDDVRAWTDGRGVDLVLNPLAGELRNASLETLKDEGLLVDISPQQPGTSQSIPIKYFEAGVRFIKLDLSRVQQCGSEAMGRVLAGLQGIYDPATAHTIPQESFAAARVEEAFDAYIRDAFVGKLVVQMAGKIVPLARRLALPIAVPDAGYLVTGGFGGMGLATIKWLCSQGARHVAVLSRSGPSSKPAQETLKELRGTGVRILHEKADIAKREDLNAALDRLLPEMPPLRGVIHCAGVLADTAINAVSASLVDRVMGPKAEGALHLHRALDRQELDFVVYYSSIAATLGNYGQLNYAAANGFLHGLVLHRRTKGLPGTCINWGPVAEVGMATRDAGVADSLARLGLAFLPLARVFELLEEALAEDWVSFDVVDINWGAWSRQAAGRERLRLSKVLPAGVEDGDDAAGAFHYQVLSLGPNERRALIFALVLNISSGVLRLPQSRIDSSSRLGDLGIDSIMAAEISQMIFDRTGIRLRILYLTRGPSLLDMTEKIEEAILSGVQPG